MYRFLCPVTELCCFLFLNICGKKSFLRIFVNWVFADFYFIILAQGRIFEVGTPLPVTSSYILDTHSFWRIIAILFFADFPVVIVILTIGRKLQVGSPLSLVGGDSTCVLALLVVRFTICSQRFFFPVVLNGFFVGIDWIFTPKGVYIVNFDHPPYSLHSLTYKVAAGGNGKWNG